MDTTWLEDFVAANREGSFSRAAEERAISQPAFSRRIRCLEEWVGAPLFDRSARTVQLTPAGERLKPFAEEILRQLETGRKDALSATQASSEKLFFAATHSLSLTFFPPWLGSLEREEPLMSTIQLTADSMQGCERLMIDGQAQFLLCHHHPAASSLLSADRFKSVMLGEDVLVPVAAPTLAGDPLSKGPFLAYAESSGMGRILRAAWEEKGQAPLPEAVFTSHMASVLVMMARDGRGVAWSPLSLVQEDLQSGRLVKLGAASDEVRMEIHLFRPRVRQLRAAERFWERALERAAQAPRN
ncbi:LysR family transcriptional regulator [Herbaspirillum huttiense]|uniref:LysR family transcriptional regulator n=1 Tax=Herbaspirillum huttiense TaxID=863372 RepID=UPI0039B10E9F